GQWGWRSWWRGAWRTTRTRFGSGSPAGHRRKTPLLSEGEERMHVARHRRVAFLSGMVLRAVGCGGGTRGRAWPPAGPPPAVVKDLQVPENPYRIIYSPPVDLAKAPDTTAHGRKPRS